MKLPENFKNKMEKLLKDEFNNFLESYKENHYKGIRINTLKISVEEYLKITPFKLEPISWIKEGFYIQGDESRPGKHPHYHCGLYYIQEPSAMTPVEVLDPKPGDRVLDISAAPGGKTTQIASKLKGQGLIIANDISPKRAKALVKNVELCGMKNCVITNESPENISNKFLSYFDKILVDAPCSGEGMFRRDPKTIKSWSDSSVEKCCSMQREILDSIPKMLKPGGRIVYSTCTFSPEEDEGTIDWFIRKYPEFEIEEIKNMDGLDYGNPDWVNGNKDIRNTKRIWPHKIKGEGHFIASLRKKDGNEVENISFNCNNIDIERYLEFQKNYLNIEYRDNLHKIENKLFLIPSGLPDMSGLRVVKQGLYIGDILKGRFEPSQGLAMSLSKKECKSTINFSSESIEAIKYLKGETLITEGEKGWKLVCIDNYPVGWGKQVEGNLKNQYNFDWRMR
ncbi:ribosomal RNA small subunit methyltransferase F [Gottschalkia purinilytica]|uniref:Ribosomal RNA small subunit methyltransferase F n=1 Tax=Gottschalkia purinilytica TaxID=1503 RepID=A0A0L0WFF3_GOTPU|nr:RsmB/NOP family class I SAM-dependent RNA methyltransferase [Gottschalkia purinilytica]KNF10161.1 ribosomal RNA small subunit methyltransferase F [Gottschalkia purinilytica]